MQLVDSHCHIHSVGGFADEGSGPGNVWNKLHASTTEEILERAHAADVTKMLCVGCDITDSRRAVDFVQRYQNTWATVGVHPHEASRFAGDDAVWQHMAELADKPKVVAIGECGFDYFYEHSDKQSQRQILEKQIELALEKDLPLIFHVRDAFDDFWPVFDRYNSSAKPIRGVLHSFTDIQANLERALGHNLCIGVNGIVTFAKKAEQISMYKAVPLDRLLLETDAPFLTPVPFRGKICEPVHIRTIAEFLAGARGQTLEEIARVTTNNAQQLFGI